MKQWVILNEDKEQQKFFPLDFSRAALNLLDTNLSIAGYCCVVKQEIDTKEKDHSVKHSQECPVNKYTPAQQGILGNIPEERHRQ